MLENSSSSPVSAIAAPWANIALRLQKGIFSVDLVNMISKKDIHKLATLARIHVTAEEEVGLTKDINSILSYIEQIKEVSSKGDDRPEAPVWRNVLREDNDPHESRESREEIIKNFPESKDDYLVVKKIL